MPHVPVVSPSRVGLVPEPLEQARQRLERWSQSREVPASALCVGRRGGVVEPWYFGSAPDSLFLIASITKPVTALAAVMLAERGLLTLGDRVVDYLPEFAADAPSKADVRLRHLLTHTSGLPDILPENFALRAAHAPLSTFVEATCRHPLLFPPGTRVRYQSMGFALLAEIVRLVAGMPLSEFLKREVFEPLGMMSTFLGAPPEWHDRIVPVELPPEMVGTDWHWNSPYWRGLGAPWGGLLTMPGDLARLCLMMLGGGTLGKVRVLSPSSVQAMTLNQLDGFPHLAEADRRCRPWGLGWRLRWPGDSANFGDLLGPAAYGHWGATGTACWLDPDADAFCIVFTTLPQEATEGRHLALISNLAAAAIA